MNYEEKIKSLNLILPAVAEPVGSYTPVVMQGDIAVLSGQISKTADGKILTGKVGPGGMSIDQAKAAARVAAINVLAIMKDMIGFQKFGRFLRVVGYVQTTPDFYDISAVVNGASDLFLEIFGEQGIHARSSLGMASLPLNAAVEIEVTLALKKSS